MSPAITNAPHPNPNGGPATAAGRAISSQNAITFGLYSTRDFIRPGEQLAYRELTDSLNTELAPNGFLETNLVNEIRRAMWRLARCGEIEESFAFAENPGDDIPDPMRNEDQAKLQLSVDRARALSHRLLHKCTAELRKLQTERRLREETANRAGEPEAANTGIHDTAAVSRSLDSQFRADFHRKKFQGMEEIEALLSIPLHPPAYNPGSFCKTEKAA